MKVVALHTDFRIYWPARLKQLAVDLSQRGDELFVIEIAGKGSPYSFAEKQSRSDNLNWACIFPNEKIEDINPCLAKKEIFKLLDEINPDVVLAGAIAFPSGASAVDWTKRNNKAVVIFDDSKLEDVPRSFIVNKVKKLIYSNVDAIFCPSPDWNDTFNYWGFKNESIFYGVDVVDNQFWGILDEKDSLNPNLPANYILCVGRQIECKNFTAVIEVFNEIKQEENNIDLVFVGDGEMNSQLREIANDSDKIHFLPFQTPNKLRYIYHHASALILSSLSETWGLVVNEAMATGLPIIISDECGCSKILVQEGENGYHFNPTDKNELFDKMKLFLNLTDLERFEMSNKSIINISQWGLERFASGAIGAIDYAVANKKKRKGLLSNCLLEKWNGRYNPI